MIDSSASRLLSKMLVFIEEHPPGTRLPSTRDLQREHRVGPGTIRDVVAELSRRGLLETRPGVGTFSRAVHESKQTPDFSWQAVTLGPSPVSSGAPSALSTTGCIDLSSGYLDWSLRPTALLMQAGARAARRSAAWE